MMTEKPKIDTNTTICISIAEKPGNFGAKFHNPAYKYLNLNWIYLPRKVQNSADLEKTMHGIRALNIKGCSVSMPHKENVIPFLDEMDDSAQEIGAVNTILRKENGSLKGYNTDFYGAKKALENTQIDGKEVLMLGAGGVARAVSLAVKELGGQLTIANRTDRNALTLAKQLSAKTVNWEDVQFSSGHLLINTTPVGMNDPEAMIVNKELLHNFNSVMDVVIYPAETKLLKTAKEYGKNIIPGTLMCVYQAAQQFKIYTNQDAPEPIINKTLKALEK